MRLPSPSAHRPCPPCQACRARAQPASRSPSPPDTSPVPPQDTELLRLAETIDFLKKKNSEAQAVIQGALSASEATPKGRPSGQRWTGPEGGSLQGFSVSRMCRQLPEGEGPDSEEWRGHGPTTQGLRETRAPPGPQMTAMTVAGNRRHFKFQTPDNPCVPSHFLEFLKGAEISHPHKKLDVGVYGSFSQSPKLRSNPAVLHGQTMDKWWCCGCDDELSLSTGVL